ncbi:thioredoxin domain-containing protein [Aurantiacibacter sp. MUD11]|uniref:DsbA family protein n=1 Tax=Aurantiacibacter sp. MUD11 TaxID=3003265 RepID=UPI0022AAE6FB|nr:thioredoxin domain-containing protein [Aurantiacibacter sp. MUD11]WAT17861.1 thioredoxin domain-containing protein [Aurantiacibacter sp. MUD11]
MKRWALAGIALIVAPAAMVAAQDWNLTYAQTERGHRVGNPEAELQLVEFVSYTCPHCATFAAQSDAPMRALYLHEGRAVVEVRSYIRNPVDLAASLVAECGEPDDFFGNHRALMLSHNRWMETARQATQAQMQRWSTGAIGARMRAIGDDLGFHELMEPRGLSRVQVDQCLSDEAKALEIVEAHEANNADFDIPGTPSFALNGQLLPGIHSWGQLQQVLDNPAVLETTVESDAE